MITKTKTNQQSIIPFATSPLTKAVSSSKFFQAQTEITIETQLFTNSTPFFGKEGSN